MVLLEDDQENVILLAVCPENAQVPEVSSKPGTRNRPAAGQYQSSRILGINRYGIHTESESTYRPDIHRIG